MKPNRYTLRRCAPVLVIAVALAATDATTTARANDHSVSRDGSLVLVAPPALGEGAVMSGGDFVLRPAYWDPAAAAEPPCPPPGCRADWNCDGVVDSDDLLLFLADWAEGGADYNGDGVTDSDDLLGFLADWSAGCSTGVGGR